MRVEWNTYIGVELGIVENVYCNRYIGIRIVEYVYCNTYIGIGIVEYV